MQSVEQIRAHIEQRLAQTVVQPFPSPHFVVEQIFPDDVFQDILRLNPFKEKEGREWIAASELKSRRQDTPYHLRKQIDLENGLADAPVDVRSFWNMVAEALVGDDWFAKQVYKTYTPFFEIRFGEAVLQPDFFDGLRHMLIVQRHDRGYSIGPHTDSPHRVFTCIFAFAEGPGFERFGTQFVRPKDPLVRCYGDLHHRPEDFEVARVADYAPNRLVVFFKTRQSFHSVREIDQDIPGDRYGMQLGYYEPKQGLFRDLSRPDLMADKTGKPLLELKLLGKTLQVTNSD